MLFRCYLALLSLIAVASVAALPVAEPAVAVRDSSSDRDWRRDSSSDRDWRRDSSSDRDWRRDSSSDRDWRRTRPATEIGDGTRAATATGGAMGPTIEHRTQQR
ncbi:hypothetical protein MSAN_00790400 [Mycena sanguinolenta]|uniref:Secreted protein n=1 Tax=Mycena sanguinolenta TaxID=230812 RepID=A0A8H7D9J0_9AGAR|nr:hypothetical protein MSAN_00790400 [Mycena sanguinolenta]